MSKLWRQTMAPSPNYAAGLAARRQFFLYFCSLCMRIISKYAAGYAKFPPLKSTGFGVLMYLARLATPNVDWEPRGGIGTVSAIRLFCHLIAPNFACIATPWPKFNLWLCLWPPWSQLWPQLLYVQIKCQALPTHHQCIITDSQCSRGVINKATGSTVADR